jgi:hypothetical protein
MSRENIKLTENQKKVLRALLTLNLKPAVDVAAEIDVSRTSLVLALDITRGLTIPELAYQNLLKVFGLSIKFEPDTSVVHYLRVGAELDSLKIVVDTIFKSATMYYVKPFGKLEQHKPYAGFFLLRFGHATTGYGIALIHRDIFRKGKGVISEDPAIAKPLLPDLFENVKWAKNPEINLEPGFTRTLEAIFYRQADALALEDITTLLKGTLTSELYEEGVLKYNWQDVRKAAEAANLTPEDLINLISAQVPK